MTSAIALLASFAAGSAYAQSVPVVPEAPLRLPVDDNGVDLATGKIRFAAPGFGIGSGGSTLAFSQVWHETGWRHNHTVSILVSGSTATVSFGAQSIKFNKSGSTYTSAISDGSTLVENTNDYVFTSRDGTVVTLSKALNGFGNIASSAMASDITYPGGEKLTFTYKDVSIVILSITYKFIRLQSVASSQGHQLKFAYQANTLADPAAWLRLASVKAINSGVDYCSPAADSCSGLTQSWPTMTFSRVTVGSNVQETVTDPAGRATRYTFDSSNRLIGIKRPGSSTDSTTIGYDSNNRVSSLVRDGVTATYAWSVSGNNVTATVSDSIGLSRSYVTDSVQRVIKVGTDGESRTSDYTYDASGRLTFRRSPLGQEEHLAYDTRGNVTSVTRVSATPGTPVNIVTEASYPSTCSNAKTCNQPTWTKDAKGAQTDYTYDPNHGGVTKVTGPAVGGVRPEARYTYTSLYAWYKNSSGTLVQAPAAVAKLTGISTCQTLAAVSCVGTADEVKTTLAYEAGSGSVRSNLLPVTTTVAAGNGSLSASSTSTYDLVGNLLTVDGPLSGTVDTVRLRYDGARQVIGVVRPDPDGGGSLKHLAQKFTYNSDAQVTEAEVGTVDSQSDAHWAAFTSSQKLTATYDAASGRKTKDVVTSGTTTHEVVQYSYDARGRLECTALRTNSGYWSSLPGSACTQDGGGGNRITRNYYNGDNQILQVKMGVGTASAIDERTLTYRPNGTVDTLTDAKGYRTTYEYDGHDRLSKIRYPTPIGTGSSSTTDYEQFTYDANGNVTQRRLRDGQLVNYTFDALNRVTLKDLPSPETDVSYGYDLLGRLKTSTQGSQSLSFAYDALGRNTSATSAIGTVAYQYDAASRRTRMTWPDSFYVTYDYQVTGEVTAIRENGATSGAGVLATFGYDSLGRRTTLTRGNSTTTSYSYDTASRLSQLVQNPAGTTHDLTLGFTYNAASQISTATRSNDAYAWTAHVNLYRPYSVDGLNRYTLSGNITPTYDGRGNLTAAGSDTYAYTAENLLKTVTGAGVTLDYDPLGRLRQTAGSATTRFGYDGGAMIGEYNTSNTLLRRYVHGPGADEPLVWYEGSGTTDRRWLHTDERGSVIAVTNGSGTATVINSYDEYGIPGTANQGRFQYTGQAWLPEIGLYYYKARVYSATLGRFLQTDPIGYGDGLNLYAYVGNDPVNARDPSGNETINVIANPGGGGFVWWDFWMPPSFYLPSMPWFDFGSVEPIDPEIGVIANKKDKPSISSQPLDFPLLGHTSQGMPQNGKPWRGSCDRALQEPGKIEATSAQVSAVLGIGWSGSKGEWHNVETGTWGTYSSSSFSVGFDFGVSGGGVTANRLSDFAGFGDSWSAGLSVGALGFSYGRSYDLDGNRTGSSAGVGAGGYGRFGGSGSFGETTLGPICHYKN